ncbi:MAG: Fe-S cluster assembly ATPase SufC [Calditrichaeota bacterium]|nr:Fe-S cluster assembly ATPase SufC [Calditrichota bacterium]
MNQTLEIRGLRVAVEGNEILRGVDLTVPPGEIHALMGPNGSGKSTLAFALMGHPKYLITGGDILLDGESLLDLAPDERAKRGLFLAFQYPYEITGVRLQDFLRTATLTVHRESVSLAQFMDRMNEALALLKIDRNHLARSVNEGFSGGEKKRAEVLQMMLLKPKVAILDETDSGLDIDALRIVSDGVNSLRGDGFSALVITHYQRLLNYIEPDRVHVMHRGRIALSGGRELALELERSGYELLREETALAG